MNQYSETLPEITRYLEKSNRDELADHEPSFRRILECVGKYRPVLPGQRLLEIGTGTGSFPILCRLSGLNCEGLDICSQLIKHARAWGRRFDVEVDIRQGNIENIDLGESVYDVIVASSVFEHIECWRPSLRNIHRGLKPGGALFFESTNKWSIKSGEFPLPCYGWFPNWARYRLRKFIHGPDVMKLGIDFHQFTYRGLRRAFQQVGFSEIHDVFDLINMSNKTGWRLKLIQLARKNAPLRELVLLFREATTFVCLK
jgi:ubiquinone/menaquinone biosynthesis C-methylase UbiE